LEKIILVVVLLICLITDLKSRRILNIVTLPTIVVGFVYYIWISGFDGFLFSGKGLLVGLGLLIIPFLLGGMGAGDVKLMAAIGALMGANFVFYSFIYTALFGGVIGLSLMMKTNGFRNLIKTFFLQVAFFRSSLGAFIITKEKSSKILFPYGVAIVLGTLCTLIWGGFE
jgi:prepilin peptidase CpaA